MAQYQAETSYAHSQRLSIRIGTTPISGSPMTAAYATGFKISDAYTSVVHLSTNEDSDITDTTKTDEMGRVMTEGLYDSFSTIAAVIRVITAENLTAMRIAILRLPTQLFLKPLPPGLLFQQLGYLNDHICAQLQYVLYCDLNGYEFVKQYEDTETTRKLTTLPRKNSFIASAIPTSKATITLSELAYQREFMDWVKSIYIKYYVRTNLGISLFTTYVTSIYSSCKEVKRPANTQSDPAMKTHGITSFAAGRHLFITESGQQAFTKNEIDFYNDFQLTLVFPTVSMVPLFMLTNLNTKANMTRNAFVYIRGAIASVLGTITKNHNLLRFIGPHRDAYSTTDQDKSNIHQIITQLYRPESQTISYAKVIVSQTAEIELPHIIIYDKNIRSMIEQIMNENNVEKTELDSHMCYIIASVVNAVRNKASVLTLQNGNPSANTIKALEDAILTAKTAAFHHISSKKK